ncbi:MAG: potassium channel family protein [Gammaproteobacteria bacterium]|nr:potassium channel family protein [Gammaproteobacteria bacterium]
MGKGNFSWLLVALLTFLIGIPLLDQLQLLPVRVVKALMFSWLVCIGVWSLRSSRRGFAVGVVFVVAAVAANLVAVIAQSEALAYIVMLALAGFLLTAIICTLRQVLIGTEVSLNRLVGAICVYLLLGVIWAVAYSLLDMLVPGSFRGVSSSMDFAWSGDWLYFSFVTMTTLGYGDFVALTPTAKTLAYMQAVFGQLYVAILVAGLVSAYISRPRTE